MILIGGIATSMLVGAVAGGAIAGVAVLMMGFFAKAKNCPDCQTELPRIRKATNTRQAMWGGWTCEKCGCEIDRKGNKIPA